MAKNCSELFRNSIIDRLKGEKAGYAIKKKEKMRALKSRDAQILLHFYCPQKSRNEKNVLLLCCPWKSWNKQPVT